MWVTKVSVSYLQTFLVADSNFYSLIFSKEHLKSLRYAVGGSNSGPPNTVILTAYRHFGLYGIKVN